MHTESNVVRTYVFTEEELQRRLGLGGRISGMRDDAWARDLRKTPSPWTLTIETTTIHPEDARYEQNKKQASVGQAQDIHRDAMEAMRMCHYADESLRCAFADGVSAALAVRKEIA